MNICLFVAHLPSCPAALFHSFTLAQLHVNKRDLAISQHCNLERCRALSRSISHAEQWPAGHARPKTATRNRRQQASSSSSHSSKFSSARAAEQYTHTMLSLYYTMLFSHSLITVSLQARPGPGPSIFVYFVYFVCIALWLYDATMPPSNKQINKQIDK